MFEFKINNKKFETEKSKMTGSELLTIANLLPAEDYELLYKVNQKGFEPIQLDEEVDLTTAGIEGFIAKPYKGVVINVDGTEYEVNECFMTPNQIMAIVNIDADKYFLMELRAGGIEVSYKDDVEHKIAITKKSKFISYKLDLIIEYVIVNAKKKSWTKDKISFEEVVVLEYGSVSNDPNVIYTIDYVKGVPSKPNGTMVKGEVISVKNKMIFNVTQTNRS
ncbi:multiubiquitin domain-containing protein [Flavobacterium rakeshii]|uniref:multiubiquitin domain-containing protein n=1 Tax=Flavobacterium rakeshii TaxID=1038845 RepID=UPI002E7B75B6|nr:multiubiquitin domain-containing protein [Flavobacterium rakeshii]MEE1899562.1 multiubiquitin domain-containing protein [Flavobacterium rakeshii]